MRCKLDKLIISNFYNDTLLGFYFVDDEIEMIYDFTESEVGNIYCGYVKDVAANLSSVFVEFGDGKKGFLYTNGQYKTGDKVLVEVVCDKKKNKDYLLSTKLSLNENEQEEVRQKFEHASPKSVLFKKDYMIEVCKEFFDNGIEIIVDDKMVSQNLEGEKIQNILYNSRNGISIENTYKLGKIIKDVLSKKVWMKSGAYLVIEHTETLTTIDVNSGKNVSKTDREENIKNINFEAAEYIIKHLQLRNISGIIIVDFINMKKDDYDELFEYMTNLAKTDYVSCNIVEFTKLGLLEITRKKNRKSIKEILCEVEHD